ncbi:hypothetical protein NX059_009536 [Plenodomus lindquistii]|nr:hypothetical protein NX059_009536 [Plenodomus lindquistii]
MPPPPARYIAAWRQAEAKRRRHNLHTPARSHTDFDTDTDMAIQGLSQSANFGSAPSGFGSPAPNENGANAFAGFGGGNAGINNVFGGGATNSFPPAQSSAPSNNFSNSSFPTFGANTQSTSFNPQPPSSNGFSFTAGGSNSSNPFGASAPAPATNANMPAPTFGAGSSLFSPQPPSNPFGGLAKNNTSSAPSANMFGPTSGASQNSNTFSTTPASTPFTFGSATPFAPSDSTPATSSIFSGFGAPTQTAPPATSSMFNGFGASTQTAPPAQNSLFNFGSNTPQKEAPSQPVQSNMFGSIGTSAHASTGFAATAPAPASNLFNFAPSTPKSDAPTPTLFGTSSAATTSNTPAPAATSSPFNFNPSATKINTSTPTLLDTSSAASANSSTPAPAPAGNPFASLAPAASPSTAKPSFSASSSAPEPQDKVPATSNNLFSGLKPMEQNTTAPTETPKANPFASLSKPASTPTETPATTRGGFSFTGAAQKKDISSGDSSKPSENNKALGVPQTGFFNAFNTPQPTKVKTSDSEKPVFNTVQSKPGTGLFAQPFTSKGDTGIINPDAFKPKSTFSSFTPLQKPSAEAPSEVQVTPQESNPFNQQSTPAVDRQNLFSGFKQAPAAPSAPSVPGFTGAQVSTLKTAELPKVPKVHVPKGWAQPGSVAAQGSHGVYQHIADLTAQLQALNDRYRQQLSALSSTADWSAISLWHYQHASDIKKKIDNARKQRAASNGVTGTESALSTKRKVNDGSPEIPDTSFKRARGEEGPATPTPQSFAPTGSVQPTATSTSNMFAKAINGTKPSSAPSAASSLFAPKTAEQTTIESPKSTAAASGFTPTSSAPTAFPSSGFKPNFGSAPTGGFKPASTPSSGGSFMSQWKRVAKTYDELAAERKQKVKDEEWDDEEETEEEWSARYDKEEAERLAAERRHVAENAPTFSVTGLATSSGCTTSTSSNPFANLKTPAGTTSAPSTFSPRAGSPALSTGSQSVLDGTSNAPTPNIFGHLSSAPSSSHQDESDEDDDGHQPAGSVEPSTPPKRKHGDSETEDDDSVENTIKRKQEAGGSSKGSLISRMTRAEPNEADAERDTTGTSVSRQSNGAQTPTSKPFSFFDFGAATSKPSSPKPESFAGDQTFKPGTPIKFGSASNTEKPTSAPLFQFQPATPAPGEFSTTPAKPPPSTLLNFTPSTSGSSLLPPNAGLSSASSMPSSVFSSRAGTPLSEAETSASAAENDDEEGEKSTQVDFSQLTDAEKEANDVIYHHEVVLARHQVDKEWVNLAKGPMWILKDKTTAKCFVRIRLPNGSTPLNYSILPSLRATLSGSSKKMVLATKPLSTGGLERVLYAVKTPELAQELCDKYNESIPST